MTEISPFGSCNLSGHSLADGIYLEMQRHRNAQNIRQLTQLTTTKCYKRPCEKDFFLGVKNIPPVENKKFDISSSEGFTFYGSNK